MTLGQKQRKFTRMIGLQECVSEVCQGASP